MEENLELFQEQAQKAEETQGTSQQPQPTMSDKLIALRQEWTQEVETLNDNMKNLAEVDHMMNIIYTKRQKAVDLYYGTLGVMNKQLRNYKKQYAALFNSYKTGQQNGIRYGSDTSINTQMDSLIPASKISGNHRRIKKLHGLHVGDSQDNRRDTICYQLKDKDL